MKHFTRIFTSIFLGSICINHEGTMSNLCNLGVSKFRHITDSFRIQSLALTLRGGAAESERPVSDVPGDSSNHLKVEAAVGPKSFARRDLLIRLQREAQLQWGEEKIFEEDAPENFDSDDSCGDDKIPPKYFCTFPYPYMNGLLHLGHAYSLSKAEFAVGYQRMLGK
jgi:hypothetical protein